MEDRTSVTNIKMHNQDGCLILTMDCGKGNLLSQEDILDLRSTVVAAEVDSSVKALVVTGAGHSFSTGLKAIAEKTLNSKEQADELFLSLDELLVSLFEFSKPIVAAVNGHSVGAGLLVQLCADQICLVESDRAKLGLPEFSLGFILDEVMVAIVKYSISPARAVEKLLYSGELFGVARAIELGLADQLLPSDQLTDTAIAKASALACEAKAFTTLKRSLRNSTLASMNTAINDGSHLAFSKLLKF